ncbi:hypothetical protein H2241_21150 [Pantoea ananatis]|uniref:hypothetical protein n=1 Tax=Pantoea ananas TaxID=553 RepID=UPI00158D0066|nr:hypothetical protein [Pantoea ananatis]MBA4823447.1 hypothetical protein [Pantoea ananatis]QKV88045.1 hypothetical protein FOB88_13375 [Pantoea ananatis]
MTLYDAAVKIVSYVALSLVTLCLKLLSKIELFKTFRFLSPDNKEKVFSLTRQFSKGYLDEYETQTKLQALGINYSPQFMKNLFYYTYKRKIRSDNKELSAFLLMSGPFICSDDGEVKLRKWIRTLSYALFFMSLLMMAIAISTLPFSIDNIHLYWIEGHYYVVTVLVSLMVLDAFGLIISFVIIFMLLYRSIPAFKFAKHYRSAWKHRDLFEVGEQNLYCGNNVTK